MTYTVSIKNTIYSTNSLGSTRAEFNLPLTDLKSTSTVPQYPNSLSTLVLESSSVGIDLSKFGTKLRALAFKSTRPVAVFIITPLKEYELPLTTFFTHLVDSKEDALTNATELRIECPPASTTAISPAPANYPNALVELFVLMTP